MNGGFSKVESANTILNNFQYFLSESFYSKFSYGLEHLQWIF